LLADRGYAFFCHKVILLEFLTKKKGILYYSLFPEVMDVPLDIAR
jgi:hypothetical protein